MKKTIFYADEIDFIHSREIEQKYRIGAESLLSLLDSGKLTAFERTPGRWCPRYPSMEPDAPNPYPKEGLPVSDGERKAEYRRLGGYELGALTHEDLKRFYFSRSEIESLSEPTSEKRPSSSTLAKKMLREHVKQQVSLGVITSKDELWNDPFVTNMANQQIWSDSAVIKYTQGLGIPEKKRGPKRKNKRS